MGEILATILVLSIKHLLKTLIFLKSHKFVAILTFADKSAMTLEAV